MRLVAAGALAALVVGLAGCGGGSSSAAEDPDEEEFSAAADRSTCLADAEQIADPGAFPADFPMPPSTVVYDAEDRGEEGTIVTGVTDLPFKEVLAALNGPAQDAGYTVTSGETEEHDAEANWEGNGYRGRWAIRESASCSGETVIQVLAQQEG